MTNCPFMARNAHLRRMKCRSLIVFCFLCNMLFAQTDSVTRAYKKQRSLYVKDLTYQINLTPFILAAGNGFQLHSKENIRVRPNEAGSVGLRVSHRWLSGALSFGIKNLQAEKRGTTEFLNLTANIFRPKFGLDAYYLSYKGQYITNKYISELPQFIDNQSYPILPHLSTLFSGANAYYVFNHKKYSYRASFLYNEIQQKSAGSFLLAASYSFFKLTSDSGFVPNDLRSGIPSTSQVINGRFNSLSLMPGYAYTFVIRKKYFITLAPSLGLMTQFQHYTSSAGTTRGVSDESVLYPRAMARAALGYNSAKWYFGFGALVDNYIIKLPQKDLLIYNIGNASFYIGYRLNVPKRFRKLSRTIDEYAPEKVIEDVIH
jgi:hypothetical protein